MGSGGRPISIKNLHNNICKNVKEIAPYTTVVPQRILLDISHMVCFT